jgi:hypothetical protein
MLPKQYATTAAKRCYSSVPKKKSNVTHLALFFLEFSFQTSCNSATIQKNAVMISEQHIATMPHDSDQCQQSELMIIAFIQGSRPLYYAKSNDAVRPTHGDVCLAYRRKKGSCSASTVQTTKDHANYCHFSSRYS